MDKAEAVEAIVEGQTPLTYQAHLVAAWYFEKDYHHEPSIEEIRQYLYRFHADDLWTGELKRRGYYDAKH